MQKTYQAGHTLLSSALYFPFVYFSVHSSLWKMTFSKPKSPSRVADPPTLQTFFCTAVTTNFPSSATKCLRHCCAGCELPTHYPGAFQWSLMLSKISHLFQRVQFPAFSGEKSNTLHLGNRPILHRFSRPLGNYGVIIPIALFPHLIFHNSDLSDLVMGFSFFK